MDPDAPRSGRVEVTLRDGRQVSHFTRFAPGTKENPLNTDGVNAKVRDLMVASGRCAARRTDHQGHARDRDSDRYEDVRENVLTEA